MTIWIVGYRRPEFTDWEIVGAFDDYDRAVAACLSVDHFVGPLTLNQPVPHERSDWPGCHAPLAE